MRWPSRRRTRRRGAACDVWYMVFDLASEMVKSRPAQRQWCVQRDGLEAYIAGAVEMLSRPIAMESGFEMVSDDGLQMTV